MMIARIVSGGQTGADRGGLDAAMQCGIPCGGWCPKGRLAEDGAIPAKYPLQEMTSKDYLKRTEANVVDSDATVVFTPGRPSRGSLRTIQFCQKHEKAWYHIALGSTSHDRAVAEIVAWLRSGTSDHDEYVAAIPDPCVLNVAGSRESKFDGIQEAVCAVMSTCIRLRE